MDVANARSGRALVPDELGERCQKLFLDFLLDFKNDDPTKSQDEPKYLNDTRDLIKVERNTLFVSFMDIQTFNQDLATTITEDYYRVYPYLCRAVKNYAKDQAELNVRNKEFYLALLDVPTRLKVRELSTTKVGQLVRISGQVVRTHPVHPELVSGTFKCLDCMTVIKNVEQQFKYTQPAICTNPECANRSRFELDSKTSRFVDFQKIRIQETQAELPRGSIPRSMEVVVRAEGVEMAQPGDRCDFIGTLIVVPDVGALNLPGAKAETAARNRGDRAEGDNEGLQGLKALGVRELHYRLAFLACSIQQTNAKYAGREWALEEVTKESLQKQMSNEEWNKVFDMTNDKHLFQNLISSLFPTIHGNEEVKKGVLLMLFGGVAKKTLEKTALRGDINICIVGDPSVAKSQFLRQVAEFSPRAVYTSGKASSAAGLTAAVVRDEESFEFVIEAGALMLADNGVCCIDEFDKMDPRDQVAIHEAMEQQTISITKAGVKATLNARTSILAAANPIGGRYDKSKSLRSNINLGAPILSRFDLFFILIDDANEVTDYAIARKIVDLHANMEESIDRVYSREEILAYITFARQFQPKLTTAAAKLLIEKYGILRQRDHGSSARTAWRITVRQLESLIRLSEAMARMYCSDFVTVAHVEEAYALLNKSIIRVEQPDIDLDENEAERGAVDDIDEAMNEAPDESMDDSKADDDDAMDAQSVADDQSLSGSMSSKSAPKKKLKLSYDKFKSISNMLLLKMRKEEIEVEERGEESDGLKRSQIVEWYLNEIGDEIQTEEELLEQKEIVEKVIDRLIKKDNVIIPLASSTLESGTDETEDEDPVLVVHPNWVYDV